MFDSISALMQPQIAVTLLAAIAAFATALTVLMPVLNRDRLDARMQVMATERDKMRAARLADLAKKDGQGQAEKRSQGLHAGSRRPPQPAQHVRFGGSASQVENGRHARSGAARDLHVLPRGHADHRGCRRAHLSVRAQQLPLSRRGEAGAGDRCGLHRLLHAQFLHPESGAASPNLHQRRLPGFARHASHLRAIGHVGRSCAPEGFR